MLDTPISIKLTNYWGQINRTFLVIFVFFLVLLPGVISLQIVGIHVGQEGRISIPVRFFYLLILLLAAPIYKLESKLAKSLVSGAVVATFCYAVISTGFIVYTNLKFPHEWDFLCWYLDGSVTAKGMNPYQPKAYEDVIGSLELPFIPSSNFVREIIQVGSKYPPPTLFYFLSLGYLSFQSAHILWTIVNLLMICVDIWLICKIFFQNYRIASWIMSTSILLLFPVFRPSLFHEQLYFFLLFFSLLTWKDKDFSRAGIWIVLGTFTKPIFALTLIYFIIRQRWSALWVAGVTAVLGFLAALLVFGLEPFFTYFIDNPIKRVPAWQYTQGVNQSLLATLLRWFPFDIAKNNPIFHPIFLITACMLTLVTIFIVNKSKYEHSYISLSLVTALAVLIYPGSLESYSILLLPALVNIYLHKNDFSQGDWGIPLLLVFMGGVMYIQAFFANLLVWLMMAIWAACCIYSKATSCRITPSY